MIIGGARWHQMETKEALKSFYDTVAKAQKNRRPMLIFIDEVDALFRKRGDGGELARLVTTAYLEMNEKPSHAKIKWVFATNRPQDLSSAIRSRIGQTVHVGLPDTQAIQAVYRHYKKEIEAEYQGQVTCNMTKEEAAVIFRGQSQRTIENVMRKLVQDAFLLEKKKLEVADFRQFLRQQDATA